MKISFYAPDSALPAYFTFEQCVSFRIWSSEQAKAVFSGAEVHVFLDAMIDSTCQLVAVEGGSADLAREAYGFCQKLLGRFCALEKLAPTSPHSQLWVGGFCRWTAR